MQKTKNSLSNWQTEAFQTSEKVLGIKIDEKLSWKEHTDTVAKSVSSKICMLKKT